MQGMTEPQNQGLYSAPALLAHLNDEQLRAVTLPNEHALILAGAGSGKTRVLTTRIAWLMHTGQVSPGGVMAVTFTNKAAREMMTRLSAMLPVNVRGMWIGTFHGLCNRLLRAHWKLAQLPQTFQILDIQDQLSAIKRLYKQFHIDDERFPPKQTQWFINSCKEDALRPKCIFLATVDEPLGLLGWKALVIDVELFVQALDRRELILDVQDLKGLRQLRQLPMGPQQAVAQAMESSDPHAPHVDGQHGRQAGHHFSGRLVGEGHRHHPTGAHLSRVHQPSDAGGQHPGLARTRPSQNQGMLIGQGDGTQLFVIEVGQQGWGAVQALVLGFGHALHCRKRMGVESDTGPKILAPGFFAPANRPAQAKRSPSLD